MTHDRSSSTGGPAGPHAPPSAHLPASDDPDFRQAHEHAAKMRPGPTGPLVGVRVIDLTQALAGPFCTMFLGDMGADVIKVEPPHGDPARFSHPFMEEDEEHALGGYFASTNRNKRGIVLDFAKEEDRQALLRLAETADVVVENYRAGVMDRLGLSYEALRARNPRLVYAAIRGFGDPRTGASPYVDWPAYDPIGQAMGGVVSMTGTADGQVLKVGPSIGDLYPGTLAALAIVSALFHARATGEGQFVDVAMVDAVMALAEAAVYRYSYRGVVTKPMGNSHPQLSPFDIYPTKDGHCAIAAPGPTHWALLCAAIDRVDLIEDERTVSSRERVENAAMVRAIIGEWTAARTTAEVVEALGGVVPVGPVNDAPALFASPHVRAREMLVAVDHPGSPRPGVLPGSPMKFAATPAGIYRPPPRLGEHTEEVLREIDERNGTNPGMK
jgi:crotonobetainyl-CoA:carnitine CoA-transferase CaiB-like acyl-CoA transferase